MTSSRKKRAVKLTRPEIYCGEAIDFSFTQYIPIQDLGWLSGQRAIKRAIVRIDNSEPASGIPSSSCGLISLWFEIECQEKLIPLYQQDHTLKTWRNFNRVLHFVSSWMVFHEHISLTVVLCGPLKKTLKENVMNRGTLFILALLFTFFTAGTAHAAAAGPIASGVDWVVDLLTSGIARSVAIIGIAVLGYMAWAGKLTWEKAIQFIIGIILVFGGATLVDILIGAVGK